MNLIKKIITVLLTVQVIKWREGEGEGGGEGGGGYAMSDTKSLEYKKTNDKLRMK